MVKIILPLKKWNPVPLPLLKKLKMPKLNPYLLNSLNFSIFLIPITFNLFHQLPFFKSLKAPLIKILNNLTSG